MKKYPDLLRDDREGKMLENIEIKYFRASFVGNLVKTNYPVYGGE